MSSVFLNGKYLPLDQAKVSVLDRGFTFGDGVYEVFLVYHRTIFRLEEHLERLNNSLKALFITNPYTAKEWEDLLMRLVLDHPSEHQSLYLQITRGISERDHAIEASGQPTVFAMTSPLPKRDLSTGIATIICDDIRWKYCHIKAITLLPSVLLRHQARMSGAKEALLIKNGYLTEGAASNVFVVSGGRIMTPPKNDSILPGITRDLVIDLLRDDGTGCDERMIHKDELFTADEIWITSSTWEIVPVIILDERPVGNGRPGKIWQHINNLYQRFKESRK